MVGRGQAALGGCAGRSARPIRRLNQCGRFTAAHTRKHADDCVPQCYITDLTSAAIREQIRSGTYETAEKMDIALSRLLDEIA